MQLELYIVSNAVIGLAVLKTKASGRILLCKKRAAIYEKNIQTMFNAYFQLPEQYRKQHTSEKKKESHKHLPWYMVHKKNITPMVAVAFK